MSSDCRKRCAAIAKTGGAQVTNSSDRASHLSPRREPSQRAARQRWLVSTPPAVPQRPVLSGSGRRGRRTSAAPARRAGRASQAARHDLCSVRTSWRWQASATGRGAWTRGAQGHFSAPKSLVERAGPPARPVRCGHWARAGAVRLSLFQRRRCNPHVIH